MRLLKKNNYLGLAVAGLATASNLGTQLAEFIIFRKMIKKVELLSRYDLELVRDIEDIYQNALASNLVSFPSKYAHYLGKVIMRRSESSVENLFFHGVH